MAMVPRSDDALGRALGEIERLRRNEAWLIAQKEAFQAAVNGAPLADSLGILIQAAVADTGGKGRCGFWTAGMEDMSLHHLVGLSRAYAERVDGHPIGPDSLACGLAVAINRPVITPDVTKEPRWEPWLWLAEEFGYRAVWSFPVEIAGGRVIGAFVTYFAEPRAPTPRDIELAEVVTGAAAIIMSRDEEARGRARIFAQRQLLIAELQRRMRGLLGSIRAMIGWAAIHRPQASAFAAEMQARLDAMARTHANLARAPVVGLAEIVREEIAALTAPDTSCALDGPDLRLSGRTAEMVTLAIHELASNSVKFGALGNDNGRLEISWTADADAKGEAWARLTWREMGIDIADPAQPGFGAELITAALPFEIGGESSLDFAADEVVAKIAFPIEVSIQSMLGVDLPRDKKEGGARFGV